MCKIKYTVKPKVTTVGAHRGGKITIDARVPRGERKSIAYHEKVEGKLMKQGKSYKAAHKAADRAEKAKFHPEGKGWRKEEKDVKRIYQSNIHKGKKRKTGGKCY